ncbi:hypothetical protein CC77DRAFT_1012462 [Alternaria alternata]|jgi:hypothetical protein|uniref:DUF7137 domain-containing protein n=3 Tax=Alternaria sect. Alternaria TaxID=2499237 RepID=A0A177D957_ALTAL|nr:hypothetical protein CC77DRAFT_1012462 [Alternaria alternata]KAB2102709.1 hypothetical protein AG0111_0g8813 [Alternaria gaisen]RYN47701.1 hypothetical protein AA0114_g7500 [Alternaria tenuissima]KAH6860458.1 hypothetical protein B0T12DRAFT_135304 [Alternaria alternata]OAG16293.1 hypothetical protein CC77DRAFT_1012462 [Alternaria alternata]OWY47470.1 hypothetical protein AALT_g6505 [Alternaria alternata]
MRPSQILAAVVAMSSVTQAMNVKHAFDNISGLTDVKNVLLGRQDNNNNNDNNDNASSDAPASTQPARTSAAAKPTATGDNNNNDDNNNDNNSSGDNASNTAKETASGTKKPSGSKTTGKGSKSTSFDARLPAGGLTMVTPNALAGTQFYKVGDWVTFAWNYTSLSVTPTAIDVLASCTANQATYTISVNMSATETEVLWNTKNTPEGQAPFLTENYKLLIYDSDLSATAAPRAGYLGAFTGFTFGMYLPQEYISLKDGYTCPNCNGALSLTEKMTLGTMLLTTGTTLGSMLYFTYQFGIW